MSLQTHYYLHDYTLLSIKYNTYYKSLKTVKYIADHTLSENHNRNSFSELCENSIRFKNNTETKREIK